MNGPRIATCALLVLACAREPQPPPVSPTPASAPPVEAQAPEPAMKPMKKVEIAVGGCLHACADPETAVSGFLDALAHGSEPAKAARFVDSTQFILDGERLGQRWAGLWRDLKTATRKEEILTTLAGLSASLREVPESQLKLVLSTGIRPIKVWTSIAVFELPLPGTFRPWTLTFKPRGLEWLVVEIDRGSPVR